MKQGELTQILDRVQAGDTTAQTDLFDVAYHELRRVAAALMQAERVDHTLQPSALINEAAMRLIRQNALEAIPNRSYFFGSMVRAMRCVLVDHARGRKARKRGGGSNAIPLDQVIDVLEQQSGTDLIALDEAIQQLAAERARAGEIVELRFFGGLSLVEISAQLDVSLATINREWRYARAWLLDQLQA